MKAKFVNELSQMAAEYYNDVRLEDLIDSWSYEKTNEALGDIFRPKDKEEILSDYIAFLREEGWDEMELKDGRSVWLIQEEFPGMVDETVTAYKIFVEDGEEYWLNNDTLDKLPFKMDDRIELVQLMDARRAG
jgi:hypothetical protein